MGAANRTAAVKVPVLRELFARLGSEKGLAVVGEMCELVSAAVKDALDAAPLNPFVKGAIQGPLDMVLAAGKGVVLDWAQRQVQAGQRGV